MQHPADRDLAAFLTGCDADHLHVIVLALHSKLSIDSAKYFGDIVDGTAAVPSPGCEEREALASQVIEQLRYFGSNSFAYGLRKASPWHAEPGVSYSDILSDVQRILLKQFSPKTTFVPLNTVSIREQEIAELLMSKTVSEIPDKDLIEMLGDTGLDRGAALETLKELRTPALGASAIFATGSVLGRKFVRDFLLSTLSAYLAKYGQRESAKQLALQLVKKIPQKAFLRIANYLGWALLAWDAYQLSGPAKRVIVPTVSAIAILRTADRLKWNAEK
jgi:uncharacterized protein YaaW (UPF0174 family)